MTSAGPQAGYDSILAAALDGEPVPVPSTLEPQEVADGALWMLDLGMSLARSSERPGELLDATAAALGPNRSIPVEGCAWALYLLTQELVGAGPDVDMALTDGLTVRPATSWAGLARTVATMAVLHDQDGAAAWVRAHQPR